MRKFRLRPVLFWGHLIFGLVAAIFIAVMSVTGCLLAFERPILEWSDRQAMRNVDAGAPREAMPDLVAAVQAKTGQPVQSITLYANAARPVVMETGRDKIYLVDPVTGNSTGLASPRVRGFFHWVLTVHRWFALSDAQHKTVEWVNGWASVLFIFLILSGWVLWLPPSWQPVALRTRLLPGWAAKTRARHFNWHNAFGFWFAVPLLAMATTGAILALPWANGLLFQLTGSPLPAQQAHMDFHPEGHGEQHGDEHGDGHEHGHGQGHREQVAPRVDVERILQSASQQQAGWKSLQLRFPFAGKPEVNVVVDRGNGAQPQLRDTYVYDAAGNLLRTDLFTQQSLGRRARAIVRFLHTGEIFGLVGETVALFAALFAALLVYTGVSLTWRRFFGKRRVAAQA